MNLVSLLLLQRKTFVFRLIRKKSQQNSEHFYGFFSFLVQAKLIKLILTVQEIKSLYISRRKVRLVQKGARLKTPH